MRKIVEGDRSVSERAEEKEKLLGEGKVTKCRVPKFAIVLFAVVGVLLIAIAIVAVVVASRAVGPQVPKCTAYVAGKDTITVVDTITNEITAVLSFVGFNYMAMVITPDDKRLYVRGYYHTDSNSVALSSIALVINTATYQEIASIKLASPITLVSGGMAITPDGTKIYVVYLDSNGISVIDTAINLVKVSIIPPPICCWYTTNILVTPDGTKAYVRGSVIDTATNKVTFLFDNYPYCKACGADIYPVIITPDGTNVYMFSGCICDEYRSANISIVNIATNKVINTMVYLDYSYFGNTRNAVITPDGTRMYLINQNVLVIDTVTNKVTATISVPAYKSDTIAITPDGTKVYVTNSQRNTVSVIATVTNQVIATIQVGNQPTIVAVTPDGTKAYVGNVGIDTISVISTVTDQVVDTFSVPYAGDIIFTRC
jgi:YVTN family beta-propeller protein